MGIGILFVGLEEPKVSAFTRGHVALTSFSKRVLVGGMKQQVCVVG